MRRLNQSHPNKRSQGHMGFTSEFSQTFKELAPFSSSSPPKLKRWENLQIYPVRSALL